MGDARALPRRSMTEGGVRDVPFSSRSQETPRSALRTSRRRATLAQHRSTHLNQAMLNRRNTSRLASRQQSWAASSDYSTRSERGECESESSVDETAEIEAAEEAAAQHEEQMQWTRKHLASDPDGNLYRGWAVGIQKGWRPFFMTVLVIIAQFTGPIVMMYWGHATMAEGLPQPMWSYLTNDGANGTVNGTANETVSDLVAYADKAYALQMKVLGTALMLILFFNGEQLLDRMDRQTDRLRYLYPTLKRSWMVTDAFFNSWCVAACAIATPFLIITAESAKDLVLDAFGLLFLSTLDEYSASIEYGIETSDFDELIDMREAELGELGMAQPPVPSRAEDGLDPLEEEFLSYTSKESSSRSWSHLWERFIFGDLCFSLARQVNLVAGCIAVPAFICTRWDPVAPPQPGEPPRAAVYPLRDTFFTTEICVCAGILVLMAHIPFVIDFAREKEHDCVGFIFIVLFRGRGDPRQADPDADDDDL